MPYYAAAFLLIAVTAEALGFGGIPVKAMETENMLFAALLLALMVTALGRYVRR